MKPIFLTGSHALSNMMAMMNKTENVHDDVLGDLISYNDVTYWSNFENMTAYQTASYIWNSEFSYIWDDTNVNTMKNYWWSAYYTGDVMTFCQNNTHPTNFVTVTAAYDGPVAVMVNNREYAKMRTYLTAGQTYSFSFDQPLAIGDPCSIYGVERLNKIEFDTAYTVNVKPIISHVEEGAFTYSYNGVSYDYAVENTYNIYNITYGHPWVDDNIHVTTVAPTTDAPTTDIPTTYVPTTDTPTTDVPTTYAPTDIPTTYAPTTDIPIETDYAYWNTNAKELSGITYMNNTLYAIGDEGILYSVVLGDNNTATATVVKNYGRSYDMEGLTNDGTNLYIACEKTQNIYKVDMSTYNLELLGSMYDEFDALATEKADTYDPEDNGLEGLAYYKNGILLVGNQDSPAGFGAFNIAKKTAEGSVDKLANKNYDITEVAAIAVDGEQIYVLDSTTGLVIDVDLKITSKGNYKLENYTSNTFDKAAHKHYLKVETSCASENPEGMYIDNNYIWYCTDPESGNSRIYRDTKF